MENIMTNTIREIKKAFGYDWVGCFKEGLALVRLNGEVFAINTKGINQ